MGYLDFFGVRYRFHTRIDMTPCLLHYFLVAFKQALGRCT